MSFYNDIIKKAGHLIMTGLEKQVYYFINIIFLILVKSGVSIL